MIDSWHSYPSIYALGHRALAELFEGNVLIEEKVDGSQFSFGVFGGDLRVRSKGRVFPADAPEPMFKRAVETAREVAGALRDGWTYRAEYLAKPKHNTLAYSRIPERHLVIFDVNDGHESYLSRHSKSEEAARIGLECVPAFEVDHVSDVAQLRDLLDRQSFLGGPRVEGIVVKNYARFGADKKALMGKYVSEAFKEKHAKEWRAANPGRRDILDGLIDGLRTEARWRKAIEHLRDAGQLEGSPRDIGRLIREVPTDILADSADEIRDALFKVGMASDFARRHARTPGVLQTAPARLAAGGFGEGGRIVRHEPQTCGDRIKWLRLRVGMTQEDFAHDLGVTVATVNRWENGRIEPSRLARRALEGLAAERRVKFSMDAGGAR